MNRTTGAATARVRTWLVSGIVGGCVVIAPYTAQAQDYPAADEAKPCPADVEPEKLALEGSQLLKKKDKQGAYEKFRCAHEKLTSYDVSGNLGLVELALEKYPSAAEHLSYAVRNWPAFTDEKKLKQRAVVEERLALAREHVLTVAVEVNRNGAAVSVDGRNVGISPLSAPLFLAPAPHRISAHVEGLATETADVDGPAGAERQVRLQLGMPRTDPAPSATTPYDSAASPEPAPAPRDETQPTTRPFHPAWLSLPIAASVAGNVVAIAMHVRAQTVGSDIATLQLAIVQRDGPGRHCVSPTGLDVQDCDTLGRAFSARDYNATGAAVGFGVAAGATLVAGGMILAQALQGDRRGPFHPGWFALPLGVGTVALGAAIGLQLRANSLVRTADETRQGLYDNGGSSPCGAFPSQCQLLVDNLGAFDASNNAALGMAVVGGVSMLATGAMTAYYYAAAPKAERAGAGPVMTVVPTFAPGTRGLSVSAAW